MINFSFAIWFYEGNHKEVIMLDVLERQTAFTSSIANNKRRPTYLSGFKFHPHPPQSVSRLVQFNLWKFFNSAPTVNTGVIILQLLFHKNTMVIISFCVVCQNTLICIAELFHLTDSCYFYVIMFPFISSLDKNRNVIVIIEMRPHRSNTSIVAYKDRSKSILIYVNIFFR